MKLQPKLVLSWSKEFLEAGKRRLAGDIKRQAPDIMSEAQTAVLPFPRGPRLEKPYPFYGGIKAPEEAG